MSADLPPSTGADPDRRTGARSAVRRTVHRAAARMGIATRAEVRAHQAQTFEQVVSFVQLREVTGGLAPFRPFRGFAISPDAALWLALTVLHLRPERIVELGAGTSSSVIAATLQSSDIPGSLVTIEHDQVWADRVRDRQVAYDVPSEVRHAPLRPRPDGSSWYEPEQWQDLDAIDLLLVDGPPDSSGTGTRRPVIDSLGPRLSPDAVVAIDDAGRPAERAMIEHWLATDPALRRRDLPAEKGLCLLSRSAAALDVVRP